MGRQDGQYQEPVLLQRDVDEVLVGAAKLGNRPAFGGEILVAVFAEQSREQLGGLERNRHLSRI